MHKNFIYWQVQGPLCSDIWVLEQWGQSDHCALNCKFLERLGYVRTSTWRTYIIVNGELPSQTILEALQWPWCCSTPEVLQGASRIMGPPTEFGQLFVRARFWAIAHHYSNDDYKTQVVVFYRSLMAPYTHIKHSYWIKTGVCCSIYGINTTSYIVVKIGQLSVL